MKSSPGRGSSGGRTLSRTETTVRARVLVRRRAVLVRGRVQGARGGSARVWLYRKVAGSWKRVASLRVSLRADGTFSRRLSGFRRGRYRVRAAYGGSDLATASAAVSRFRLA